MIYLYYFDFSLHQDIYNVELRKNGDAGFGLSLTVSLFVLFVFVNEFA